MGETTNQIASHIENKREDLKSNLQELETRVKSATDWRTYFEKHPGALVAAAFGGGALLSMLIGRGKRSNSVVSSVPSEPVHSHGSAINHQVLENWDKIKSALVGVAATKFKSMLGEVVPGFSEHLAKAEGDKDAYSADRPTTEMAH